jgi:hypothetical protein
LVAGFALGVEISAGRLVGSAFAAGLGSLFGAAFAAALGSLFGAAFAAALDSLFGSAFAAGLGSLFGAGAAFAAGLGLDAALGAGLGSLFGAALAAAFGLGAAFGADDDGAEAGFAAEVARFLGVASDIIDQSRGEQLELSEPLGFVDTFDLHLLPSSSRERKSTRAAEVISCRQVVASENF